MVGRSKITITSDAISIAERPELIGFPAATSLLRDLVQIDGEIHSELIAVKLRSVSVNIRSNNLILILDISTRSIAVAIGILSSLRISDGEACPVLATTMVE